MPEMEVALSVKVTRCANGETYECMLLANGRPVYPSGASTGVFLRDPSPSEAVSEVLRSFVRGVMEVPG